MKKYFLIFFSFVALTSIAQKKEASPESKAYHDYRLKITKPPYSLQKIQNLVSHLKMNDEDLEKISDKTYASLSFREKFTYHMIHKEAYSQICDIELPIKDEQKKIFAEVVFAWEESEWSERQIKFFKDNRDSVIKLMSEGITRTNRVGLNYKDIIIELKAKEMIPLLISTYNIAKKDGDILTVLMLLMKDGQYKPFIESASYKKLYGENGDYRSYLVYNKANADLIIKRAMDFYNASK